MSTYVDPSQTYTKDPTRTSFANTVRNNQVDHEARIVQNTSDIATINAITLGPVDSWAYMWGTANGAVSGLSAKLDITWSEKARHIKINTGVSLVGDNRSGSGDFIIDAVTGNITGACSSCSDNWDHAQGTVFTNSSNRRPRVADFVWGAAGLYAEIDPATRSLKIVLDCRISGNDYRNFFGGYHVFVHEMGGM